MNTEQLFESLSDGLGAAIDRTAPAVVQVRGRPWRPASGIVYGRELVLVAAHTLEREDEIAVSANGGGPRPATLVGHDLATDLALVRVPGLDVHPPEIATGLPRTGQFALLIGRSRAGAVTASCGIVSSIAGPLRTGRGRQLDRVIRTDAVMYPGGSGGALVDWRGRLLGILTTGLLRGVPLAIPAETAWQIAGVLGEHGRVKAGYLGISSQPVRIPEAQRAGGAAKAGLLVVAIRADGPAHDAGLLVGDILVGFDGHPVEDPEELLALLTADRIGKAVPLDVLRAGRRTVLTVTVGERPAA